MPSAGRRRLLVGLTVALPWLLLALAEGALRAAGYGDDWPLFVPYRDDPTYLMPNEAVGRRWFRGAFVPSTHLDFFRATKPPRGLRLFFQGESSAAGYPYGHGGAPSRLIERRLQAALPGREVEVVNAALTAVSSYVLLDQADEIVGQRPDAVLVYAGHNEFYGVFGAASTQGAAARPLVRAYLALRGLRLVQLAERALAPRTGAAPAGAPGTVMELMAGGQLVPLGSDTFARGVAQFRANLDALLARYQRAGIPVFVGTLVSNERDQPPLARDAGADSAYAAARALDARGDLAAARPLYRLAKERDPLRFRAPEAMNAVIREVAARRGATVVETEAAVERASPGGVAGHALILEHLHPNVDGYAAIAGAFYDALRPSLGAADATLARADWPVTPLDSLAGLYRADRLTSGWPFRARGETVPAIVDTLRAATPLASYAQRLVNGAVSWAEATERLRAAAESAGATDLAIRYAQALASEYRYSARPWLDAARVAAAAGRDADALRFARLAHGRKETAESAALVGLLALRAGDAAGAVPFLQRAVELSPNDGAARGALAAARMLPRLLAERARAPRDTTTLRRLAQAYALTGQPDSARAVLGTLPP